MNDLEMIVFVIIIFVMVYAIIDRICKCVEYCALGKAYTDTIKSAGNANLMSGFINEVKKSVEQNKK